MTRSSMDTYVNLFVNYIKENFSDKVNRIVVYGDYADKNNTSPESFDVALGLVSQDDLYNFDLLGEMLSYLGDIVTDGDCSLFPISDKIMSVTTMEHVKNGVEVYAAS